MLAKSKALTFSIGFIIGVFLYAIIFVGRQKTWEPSDVRRQLIRDVYKEEYLKWLNNSANHNEEKLHRLDFGNYNKDLSSRHEARFLFDLIEIVCVVFVESPKNAYLIHNTWGRKCNSLYFYSKVKDNFIETNVIPFVNKWQYFCDALRHLYKNHRPLQWVLFSLDDVYVIPENLRYFVATKNPNVPYYFGHNVHFWQQLYNSDKTSFVLSRGAVEALVRKFNSSTECAVSGQYINDAVYSLGKHLSTLGISPSDGRDHLGRERFHIFTFEQLISEEDPQVIVKYSRTSVHPVKQGEECCSDTSISFRSSQNDRVYFLSYLMYNMNPSTFYPSANRKTSQVDDNKVWIEFVRKELGNIELSNISSEKYYDLWCSRMWEPEEFNRKIREEILSKIHTFI